MRARTLTAAHAVCYINGQVYAFVNGFNWDSQTPARPIYGLDSADPYELAPTTTKVSGTIGVFRTVADKGAQGAGIVPYFEQVPNGKYFSISIVDRSTDMLLFQSDTAILQSESWSIPSKGLITGQLRFEAITWTNQ